MMSRDDRARTVEVLRQVLLGAVLSWIMSVTLGMVFAVSSLGKGAFFSPAALSMTVGISSLIALVGSPLAAWAARAGGRNLLVYGSVLWGVLAAHIIVGVKHWLPLSQESLLALAVAGTVAIGFVPRRARR
jgi:hypothetical protein